jgi:hypothetical protein
MAHQITITLSDQEYATLSTEAERSGKPIDTLLYETLTSRLPSSLIGNQPISDDEFAHILYQKGIIVDIPTGEPLTPEEDAEMERFARLFSGGKMASDMVIEDRGDY